VSENAHAFVPVPGDVDEEPIALLDSLFERYVSLSLSWTGKAIAKPIHTVARAVESNVAAAAKHGCGNRLPISTGRSA